MQRRQVLKSVLSLPAFTALPAAAQEKPPETHPIDENPKLPTANAEAVAETAPRFFSARQLATLRRLCELLIPSSGGKPGANEAGVAEFLDFLISQSPANRQALYRDGLDKLESESHQHFQASFVAISPRQASQLLAPLQTPWTYDGPPDPLARFLHEAKEDTLRATMSSREWAAAGSQRRGASGLGTYWYAIES
jgi:hypothetical protein